MVYAIIPKAAIHKTKISVEKLEYLKKYSISDKKSKELMGKIGNKRQDSILTLWCEVV